LLERFFGFAGSGAAVGGEKIIATFSIVPLLLFEEAKAKTQAKRGV
jgi:hypothetical protein